MLRLAAAACALALAIPAAALAEDAPYVEWANHLPALPGQFTPNTFDDCADADPACVQATLDEMYRRYGELIAADCDHNAVFALTYIRVTEIYAENAHNGFFEEEDFLAREDAVFARLYFDSYDAWAAGEDAAVPPAWQMAFDTARDRAVPALGNMLQGINAHVNRDMPFMLAGLGLTKPDGTSRKRDHDAMNELLNRVYDDVIAEMTQRFDPSVDDFDPPGALDNLAGFQILPLWREGVWRNAELLTLATTPEARAGVAQWIELYALLQAQMIRSGFGYRGDQDSTERDAHCAAQDNSVEDARPPAE
ncbi:MAG: DUF5995 family protein [Thermoleophilaceae bacterium]